MPHTIELQWLKASNYERPVQSVDERPSDRSCCVGVRGVAELRTSKRPDEIAIAQYPLAPRIERRLQGSLAFRQVERVAGQTCEPRTCWSRAGLTDHASPRSSPLLASVDARSGGASLSTANLHREGLGALSDFRVR